ncbi:unnamed protein product [Fasciola hepatica]|uniref:Uncharacterized protein n=1 Tax=Fasciola hepatica TaxID=6192 RepID=A0ABC9HHA8_FASHE
MSLAINLLCLNVTNIVNETDYCCVCYDSCSSSLFLFGPTFDENHDNGCVPDEPLPYEVISVSFPQDFQTLLNSNVSAVPKTWDATHTKEPVPEASWDTALALAYFETVLATRALEWKLLARKANGWLMEQVTVGTTDAKSAKKYCDTLIAEAKKFLANKI